MLSSSSDIIIQTREVYDRIASQFSGTRSFLWADLKPFAAYAQEGDRVLDIGCGNGRLLQLFKDKDISYTGIDQSAELLNIARKKFPDAEFVVADMRKLPFLDATFDIIFCIAAFHHLSDESGRLGVLAEMRRVLKPGGCAVLTNWHLYSDWAKKKYGDGERGDFIVPWKKGTGEIVGERYYHGFVLSELSDLAKKAHVELEEQYYVKKGERSDEQRGENIVTIFKKAA